SFGLIIATAVIGPIENHNLLALGMAVATVLICIAYVHWIDAPFERWRQAPATRTNQKRIPASLPQPQGAGGTAYPPARAGLETAITPAQAYPFDRAGGSARAAPRHRTASRRARGSVRRSP